MLFSYANVAFEKLNFSEIKFKDKNILLPYSQILFYKFITTVSVTGFFWHDCIIFAPFLHPKRFIGETAEIMSAMSKVIAIIREYDFATAMLVCCTPNAPLHVYIVCTWSADEIWKNGETRKRPDSLTASAGFRGRRAACLDAYRNRSCSNRRRTVGRIPPTFPYECHGCSAPCSKVRRY